MNLLTIGSATTDALLLYKDISRLTLDAQHHSRSFFLLEEGQKVNLDDLIFHTGGGAINSAVSCKRLGLDVSTFCKIGTDKAAEFILQRLEQDGINTTYIKQTDAHITGHSSIIPCQDGDRIVLTYRGANAHITPQELAHKAFELHDNIYITSLCQESAQLLPTITQLAKQHKALVANNPGSSQLSIGSQAIYEALPNIDIFILNRQESCTFMLSMIQQNTDLHHRILSAQRELMRNTKKQKTTHQATLLNNPIFYQSVCFDIRMFFQAVLAQGPKIVIVTNGAEGVYLATKDGIIFHPSLPTEIVNTLGAGDAFGSTFVTKYIQGASIKDAMLYGILNACSVLNYLDAKTGLLHTPELEKRFKSTPKDLFGEFDMSE